MMGHTVDNAAGAAADATVRQKLVNAAIADVSHIATLPEITLKIVEIVEDPDSTAADLHRIIANDPALCARVLKVVNSAFYGLPGQIGSINRAIVLLGLNAVKNIAIATSLATLFRSGQLTPHVSARDIWNHSMAVGAGAKLLAERLRMNLPDEAFLAGLIHDIGLIVEAQVLRPRLVEVLDAVHDQHLPMLAMERKVIGADHQDFGRALCEKWKFPRPFVCAAGWHHNPMELSADTRALACVVHVADVLAARAGLGFTGTVGSLDLDPLVLSELKLTDTAVAEVAQKLPEAFDVAGQLMS
jgi:HD-like signal output (HDOD) protein